MLAIIISCLAGNLPAARAPAPSRAFRPGTTFLNTAFLASLLLTFAAVSFAQTDPSEQARIRQTFNQARAPAEAAPKDLVAAWQFGRAAYDLADAAVDNQDRQRAAEAGIAACRRAISLDATSAPSYYYLALNLGELAQAKKMGALKSMHEMEHALLKAQQLDSAFDYAGPDRSLGMLYLEAPGWPVSVGNRNKARAHLEAAVALSPDYPENHLALAEVYARWGEVHNLDSELQRMTELLPRARDHFTGQNWTASWRDWDQRLQNLQKTRTHLASAPRISPAERGAKTGQ